MAKRNDIGRGLDALISTEDIRTVGSSSISEVSLDRIYPNPDQPRREFEPESLRELADSISKIGLIQPITLRKMDDGYQIISGERRFRAAKSIGLQTVPAYIKTADDDAVMEMALVENIQREDLNAIEVALSCQKLTEVYHLTHEQLSERLGKKRATVSNYIRLLRLPAEIQMGLKDKKIDMGHARALLSVDSPTRQLEIYQAILKNGYSVRKVEELVHDDREELAAREARKQARRELEAHYAELRELLAKKLGVAVQFNINEKGKGSISIPFASEKALQDILGALDKLL